MTTGKSCFCLLSTYCVPFHPTTVLQEQGHHSHPADEETKLGNMTELPWSHPRASTYPAAWPRLEWGGGAGVGGWSQPPKGGPQRQAAVSFALEFLCVYPAEQRATGWWHWGFLSSEPHVQASWGSRGCQVTPHSTPLGALNSITNQSLRTHF